VPQVKEGGLKVWQSSGLSFEALARGGVTYGNDLLLGKIIKCYKKLIIRSALLWDAASSGNLLPTFRNNVSVPSSKVWTS
jgi:hypothetical protein